MNTDVGLQARVQVATVPEAIAHKSRKEEIEELVNYLRVILEGPENVMLINVQEDTPGVDGRPYPWLKLDSNGYPDTAPNIYVWHEGDQDWVNQAPAP